MKKSGDLQIVSIMTSKCYKQSNILDIYEHFRSLLWMYSTIGYHNYSTPNEPQSKVYD